MKKTQFFIFLALGGLLGGSLVALKFDNSNAFLTKAETTPELVNDVATVIYQEDFESYELGVTPGPLGKVWSDGGLEIIEHNSSKAVKITPKGEVIGGVDCHRTLPGGGDAFVNGYWYRFEFDFKFVNGVENTYIHMDFNSLSWNSAHIYEDKTIQNPSANGLLMNGSTVNGHTSFDLKADGGSHYLNAWLKNPGTDTKVIIDNFKITKLDTLVRSVNISGIPDGTYAPGAGTAASYSFYNEGYGNLTSAMSNGVRYLEWTPISTEANSWPVMYFNQLGFNFLAGNDYRIVIDLLEAPDFTEFYINIEGNWRGTTFTIRPDGTVTADNTTDICDFYITPTKVIMDYHCTNNISQQQVRLCFFNPANASHSFKITGFNVYNLDAINAKDYSNKFLSATSVCDPTGNVNNITTDIWSEQKANYEALTSAAKTLISEAAVTENSYDVIELANARYEYIATKYSATLENYLGRTLAATANPLLTINGNNESAFILIAAISSVVILLAFLFIKVRKNKTSK